MNWGKSIILVYVLFAGMIIYLAVSASRTGVDLVQKDYYQQELVYSDRMEEISNNNTLGDQAARIEATTGNLVIHYPQQMASATGEVLFFRPSDKSLDFKKEVAIGTDNRQVIPTNGILPGLWTIKLRWSTGDKTYYKEENVVI